MYPVPRNEQNKVTKASSIDIGFEQAYLKFRNKSNRVLSDAEVRELPNTFFYSLHRTEWVYKADMVQRLIKHLNKKDEQLTIMDLACETGWLAANIAQDSQHEVYAVGSVLPELTQGARVFPFKNLHFILGDIFEDILEKASFDYIILFDAIQFYPNLEVLINRCREYLKLGGEIHILSSPLVLQKEVEPLLQQKEEELEELKTEDLLQYWHCHARETLRQYDHEYMYRPGGIKALLGKNQNPYPWIRISN